MTGCDVTAVLPELRQLRHVPSKPAFDVTATFIGTRNYNRYEIEEVVGSAVAAATGWPYESRSGDRRPQPTDVSLRVHLLPELTTVGIRVGVVPLHRRPYRQASRSASLRPPLARALVLLAGMEPACTLLDPFCGAGTIPIEAALAEAGVACGGCDVDPAVVALARDNASRAGVPVRFQTADAHALPHQSRSMDRVATNPPWGRLVPASGPLAGAWRDIRRVLREDGRVALLGPSDLVREAGETLSLPLALRNPVSVLGQHVEIAVLAPDDALTTPGQLLSGHLADAHARYADAVLAAPPARRPSSPPTASRRGG
jgi:tRNA (guanine6-N2)-methyltransferase